MCLTKIVITITILVVICIFFVPETAANIKVYGRKRSFPNKTIIYHKDYSFEKGRLLYLLCDEDNFWNCTIVEEGKIERKCDITLPFPGVALSIENSDNFVMAAFGENKIFLIWNNSKKQSGMRWNIQYTIVNLDDCKKTDDFKLHNSLSTLDREPEGMVAQLFHRKVIVAYNNSLDIVFKKDHQEYKLKINSEGKVIEGPVVFMNDTDQDPCEIYSIAAHSPIKGFVFTRGYFCGERLELILSRPDGTEKQIDWLGNEKYLISVVNETIGVCRSSWTQWQINCAQYNSTGELLFKFSYNYTDYMFLHNIYTLPNEGFILQFLNYRGCNAFSCSYSNGTTFMKMNSTGNPLGKFIDQSAKEDMPYGGKYNNFWKVGNNYCSSLTSGPNNPEEIQVLTYCFDDNDFLS